MLLTAVTLQNRGLFIDSDPSDFLYDRNAGFSIIDFDKGGHDNVMRITRMFGQLYEKERGVQRTAPSDKVARRWVIEPYEDMLDTKIKFVTAVKDTMPQRWLQWKQAQGTDAGFLWQRLCDIPDHPTLNAKFEKLQELGVAWDVPAAAGQTVIRSKTVEELANELRPRHGAV